MINAPGLKKLDLSYVYYASELINQPELPISSLTELNLSNTNANILDVVMTEYILAAELFAYLILFLKAHANSSPALQEYLNFTPKQKQDLFERYFLKQYNLHTENGRAFVSTKEIRKFMGKDQNLKDIINSSPSIKQMLEKISISISESAYKAPNHYSKPKNTTYSKMFSLRPKLR